VSIAITLLARGLEMHHEEHEGHEGGKEVEEEGSKKSTKRKVVFAFQGNNKIHPNTMTNKSALC
jgi:hypothetical protein